MTTKSIPVEPLPPNSPRPPYSGSVVPKAQGPARVHLATRDRKLAPVAKERYEGPGIRKLRPVAVGPYVAATYVSIRATCADSCVFKDAGCYVQSGFTGRASRLLDELAGGLTPDQAIEHEASLLRRAFKRQGYRVPQDGGRCGDKGRDLRLHIGGDTPSTTAAKVLAQVATEWAQRGGGLVWTYTHRWREIHRAAFGAVSALASVETPGGAHAAVARNYVPAVVVPRHAERRRHRLSRWPRGWTVVPCPAETTEGVTCVTCRLCLDDSKLWRRKTAIAFAAHGQGRKQVVRRLKVLA